MTVSLPTILLASGLWLLLLVGCALFALFAIKQKQRAEQAEASLKNAPAALSAIHDTASTETDAFDPTEPTSGGAGLDEDTASELAMYRDQLDRLRDMLRSSEEQLDELRDALEQAEATTAAKQGSIDSLEAERDMLSRQVQNLTAGIEAGGKDVMREMIVNFTEESRELLEAIEQAGVEKAALQQQVLDMQADGKGTKGTVVGLQRKLSEAEAQIAQLERGGR